MRGAARFEAFVRFTRLEAGPTRGMFPAETGNQVHGTATGCFTWLEPRRHPCLQGAPHRRRGHPAGWPRSTCSRSSRRSRWGPLHVCRPAAGDRRAAGVEPVSLAGDAVEPAPDKAARAWHVTAGSGHGIVVTADMPRGDHGAIRDHRSGVAVGRHPRTGEPRTSTPCRAGCRPRDRMAGNITTAADHKGCGMAAPAHVCVHTAPALLVIRKR